MENSPYTDATLEIFETLWAGGFTNLGVVLQSALFRTAQDLPRVVGRGARVRLVKGAYKEAAEVAYQRKADVDAAYVMQMQYLLREGTFPALATHDADIIDAAKAFVAREGIAKDRFEFQMLYGVRRDLQATLAKEGYGMRVYVPFGRQWFPVFHATFGRTPRQRRVRSEKPRQREISLPGPSLATDSLVLRVRSGSSLGRNDLIPDNRALGSCSISCTA